MSYTNDQLQAEIADMYPEIPQHKIALSLDFNPEKNA